MPNAAGIAKHQQCNMYNKKRIWITWVYRKLLTFTVYIRVTLIFNRTSAERTISPEFKRNNVHNALETLNSIADNYYLVNFYQCYQMNIFVKLLSSM